MGGLRKHLPWTFACFCIAALSLAGIWPLAGFFSKEEVLAAALDSNPVLFACAIITTFITAFYIFRVIFLVFAGKYRGTQHLHESSKTMLLPMVILAVPAFASGWVNASGGFEQLFIGGASHSAWTGLFGMLSHPLAWISLAAAACGILAAYILYVRAWINPDKLKNIFGSAYAVLTRKYWMDDLYEKLIADTLLYRGAFAAVQWFDRVVVSGATNCISVVTSAGARKARRAQNGAVQFYAIIALAGIFLITLVMLLRG
jgi:NADH-quinone oxidoreductase subunit L